MEIMHVVNAVIKKRIALLTQIITDAPADEPGVCPAIIQLASIGTRESSDVLMRLIEQCSNPKRQMYMAGALIVHSPFRNDYFTTLGMLCSDPLKLVAIEGSMLLCDQRVCGRPFWQELVEAIQQEVSKEPDVFDPAVGD